MVYIRNQWNIVSIMQKICWSKYFYEPKNNYAIFMINYGFLWNGILGQKLGYDRCLYLSFFVWRLEDEIFDSTGRIDLNTKYTIFDLRCYECLWCNYECRTTNTIWLGQETTTGFQDSLKKGIRLRWGKYSFTRENDRVLCIGLERGDTSWPDILGWHLREWQVNTSFPLCGTNHSKNDKKVNSSSPLFRTNHLKQDTR